MFKFVFLFLSLSKKNNFKKKGGERKEYIPEWTNNRITTPLWQRSKVASRFLKERFRSHQYSLALIGCCKIIYRAFSVVIFFCFLLVWMRRLAAGMGVGVRSMPTGSFGWGGLMLKDPKPPMIPKETSVTTHREASTKMYGIKKNVYKYMRKHNHTWFTNFNEPTNTLLYKIIISHTLFSKGWWLLCVRDELETGTDCYIDPKFFFDHSSSTFSSSGLGCSTVGHWGTKALCLPLALFGILSPTNSNRPGHLVILLFNVHMLLLIYTGASLHWRLGRGSIYNTYEFRFFQHHTCPPKRPYLNYCSGRRSCSKNFTKHAKSHSSHVKKSFSFKMLLLMSF